MADPIASYPPVGVDPQDWINAQRQQMLAQALLGNAMQPIQQPETTPVKGLYVQPRVGAAQPIAKLAAALLGGRAQKQALQSQLAVNQELARSDAAGGQPIPGTGVPLQAAPSTSGSNTDQSDQGVQPLVQRNPGQSLAQTVQASQPQFTPVNPRNPWGLPGDVVARMQMTDPAGYAKYLQGPEWAQQARAAGVDPGTAARALLAKQTAQDIRPGGTMIDPISGRTVVGADPSKGEYYVVGPNGQIIAQPIQNDAQLQAIRTGLTTAATQANTPREIPMGGGVTRLGYPPTPPALQGGSMPGGASQPGVAPAAAGSAPAPAPGAAPGAAPPPPAAVPQLARPPAPAPGAGVPAQPPPMAQAPTAGGVSSTGAWANIPKLQIPSSPGQTSNTFQQANLQAASAKHAELVNTYGQQTALADQQLQYNAQASRALPNAEVGPMSEWLTTNRQRLIEMGVPESLIPGSGTVTPTLELNKYLKNAALQGARSIYGNRMTQNEVQLQTQEMSPSTHMTAAAVQSLVQQSNIQSQYQKQRAADYSTYVNRGGDPMQFESWYATNRPLSRFAAQQMTPTTPGKDGLTPLQRLQQRPDTLPQFQATFGWDPTQ
jgi:hypothetical protein